MSGRKGIKTTKKQIIDYWASHAAGSCLNVEISEAGERCWRCGCQQRLQRCHIVPDSLGGEDVPSNFVLLCNRCHLDNPNVADSDIMWDWLRAYELPLYDIFWCVFGMKEYERIYGVSFREEIENRNIPNEAQEEWNEIIKEVITRASYHFGDPHLNLATLAGVYRMALKAYDARHGLRTAKTIRPCVNMGEFL